MADGTQKPGGIALVALLLSILALLLIGIGGLREKAMEKRLEGAVQYRLAEATQTLEGRFEDLERAHRLEQLDRIQGSLTTLKNGLPADRVAEVEQIRKAVAAFKAKIQGAPEPAPASPKK
jgi:hypothetical protein